MIYRIDAQDVIVHVDGAFRRFAEDAGAPDLPDAAIGRPLWSFIGDDELTAVYAALVARARAGRTVQVQTRCSSPSLAGVVEMDIKPRPEGGIEFECRAGRARLLCHAIPSGDLLRLCAWCYRAERDGVWRGIEDVVVAEGLLERRTVPIVTHGICDECLADTSAALDGAGAATALSY